MGRVPAVALLVVMWIPAVLIGLVLDAREIQPEWWVRAAGLVAYSLVVMPLWWWAVRRGHQDRAVAR